MNYFCLQTKYQLFMKLIIQKSIQKFLFAVVFLLSFSKGNAQTPVPMASQPGNTYTENFSDMANWTNNFAAGIGANRWASYPLTTGGSANDGKRTTKNSATFSTGVAGGVQKGTGNLIFLSTGSSTPSEAVAVDLLLDFTGTNAGTLSYNWAAVDNGGGTRPTSLRVFWSTNNSTFTEITAAQVIDVQSVNSGAITTIALPASFNNSATARLRFYNHAGAITGAGNRDKISIDDVTVTATPSAPQITATGTLASLSTVYGTASTTTQFTVSGALMTAGITITPPVGFEVATSSDFSTTIGTSASPLVVGAAGTIPSTIIYVRLAANATVGNKTGPIVLTSSGATTVNVQTNATNTVSAKGLTITGLTANDKTFDNNTTATLSGTATLVGVVSGDGPNVILGGTPVANFNDATVNTNKPVTVTGYTISGSAASNYTLSQPTGLTASILPSGLQNQTITFGALTPVTYGDAAFNLTATASSSLPVSYSSSNTNVATIAGNVLTITGSGSVTITAMQAGDSNYNPATDVSQTLIVNKKNLTITGASANNKIYDADTPATITGGTLVGVLTADLANVGFTGGGDFDDINVGTAINVTANLSLTGTRAAHYTLTQPTLAADITPKQLTITGISIANKQYDTTNVATINGTASLVGVFFSDFFDVTLGGAPVANFNDASVANNKPVTVSGYTISGALSGNYYLTQPTGLTANITLISLTIVGLTANDKTYDRTTAATLSGTASLSGILPGDELNVSLAGTPSANFLTLTAGTNKPVAVTGYSLSGTALANYTLASLTLTATITKKDLTINSASVSDKLYDGTATATISGTLNGVISPDAVTLNLSGNFNNANVGTNKPVTSTSTITGADASNYNLLQPTTLTASITAAACTSATSGIITWNFATAAPSSNTSTGITVSNVSQVNNNGLSTLISSTSPSTYSGASGTFNAGAAAFTGALTTGSTYFEFTLTPQFGFNAVLTALSFGSRSTNTGPQAYTLRSSADGYVSNVASGTFSNNSVWVLHTPTIVTTSSVNAPITFRLYGSNGTGNAGLGSVNWRIDDLKLTVSAVPVAPLSSAATATTCTGETFSYTPTSVYAGATITWTRAAVAGISNAAVTTPQATSISEALINTTNASINVLYQFTITTTTCFLTQNVTVTVNPMPTWYLDADNDGYYIGTPITQCASPGAGYNTTATIAGDCNDNNNLVYQNGTLFIDNDNDGYDAGSAVVCYGATAPTGYALTSLGLDCNDNNNLVYQSATLFIDNDNDGYNAGTAVVCYGATVPTGYALTSLGVDCNDNNNLVYQSATLFIDNDNDGYDAGTAVVCYGATVPTGYALTSLGVDCNDNNNLVYQSATLFIDNDNDGYDAGTAVVCYGATVPTGYALTSLGVDCNDNNNLVYQSATLFIDNDNDGYDAGTAVVCYGATVPTGYILTSLGLDCNDNAFSTTNSCSSIVNLKLYLQGYYLGAGMMNSVKFLQAGGAIDEVEDLTVELHDATTYALIPGATTTAVLKTDGTAVCTFTSAPSGSFYVVVKGSNMVQTWSANPIAVGATPTNYDFSTAATQAYGGNMIEMVAAEGIYGFYSGDINQDEVVDGSDSTSLSDDIDNSAFGVLATDLNGDGSVDGSDYTYFSDNAENSVFSNHP
jgi:hypothetical protein